MQDILSKILIGLALLFAITACGGGSDNPGPTPDPNPAPNPMPTALNIIVNGGFEDDAADSQASGAWQVDTADGKAVIQVVESTAGADARTGTKALAVSVNALGENTFSIEVTHGPIEVETGKSYNYSFWVKGDAGKRVNFTIGLPNFTEIARTDLTMTGDWQEATLSVGISSTTTMIRLPVHFSIDGNIGSTFFLDDLSLIEGEATPTDTNYSAVNVPSLKALAPDNLVIGVAVPAGSAGNSVLTSTPRSDIVKTHFNQVTAENIMKMDAMQPSPGSFSFDDANALVTFAQTNGMTVHGHALVWHNQMPAWMRNFNGSKDEWIAMMETHAETVAAHFHSLGNTVTSWDVVNEAFSDNSAAYSGDQGGYRGLTESGGQDSPWYDNIGPEYLELAFRKAREADPDADLYYNDYSMIGGGQKFNAARAMIVDFLARGVPISGIGFQTHNPLNFPTISSIRTTLQSAVDIDPSIKVKITELDIRITKGSASVLSSSLADQQKQYYKELVEAYLDIVPVAQRGGISVWGITDGDSWIPNVFPSEDWPLLFFSDFTPKPALQGFADGLQAQ